MVTYSNESTGVGAGTWMHNPVTGELGHLLVHPAETDGQRMEAELWLQPGAAVIGTHTHSAITETFAVLEGLLGYTLDGTEAVAAPGESAIIPPGAAHDWWNAGDAPAHIRFTIASTDPSRPMAARFLSLIEFAWGMGAAGHTNARGLPGPLWVAAMAQEYADVMRLTRPPEAVQKAIFGPLARLARARGRDPLDPGLHGDRCPAAIAVRDEDERDRLLAAHAPAGAAR